MTASYRVIDGILRSVPVPQQPAPAARPGGALRKIDFGCVKCVMGRRPCVNQIAPARPNDGRLRRLSGGRPYRASERHHVEDLAASGIRQIASRLFPFLLVGRSWQCGDIAFRMKREYIEKPSNSLGSTPHVTFGAPLQQILYKHHSSVRSNRAWIATELFSIDSELAARERTHRANRSRDRS